MNWPYIAPHDVATIQKMVRARRQWHADKRLAQRAGLESDGGLVGGLRADAAAAANQSRRLPGTKANDRAGGCENTGDNFA